jgi:hypothetical protein
MYHIPSTIYQVLNPVEGMVHILNPVEDMVYTAMLYILWCGVSCCAPETPLETRGGSLGLRG